LGANRGEFAAEVIRQFGVRCYSVEASPALYASMPTIERLTAFNYAIASRDEPTILNLSDEPEASSIRRAGTGRLVGCVVVPGRTFDHFITECGIQSIDLLKIDIEGAEVDLFQSTEDQTLARISQISVEFHDFCGIITSRDVDRIKQRLVCLGFYPIKFGRRNLNWLFIKCDRCALGLWQRRYIRYVASNVRLAAAKTMDICLRPALGIVRSSRDPGQ
jgi:FkbM family methyltransferase